MSVAGTTLPFGPNRANVRSGSIVRIAVAAAYGSLPSEADAQSAPTNVN